MLRAIAAKLKDDPPQLDNYVNMVFTDSLDDLSQLAYVKQAGRICVAVVSSSPQAFTSHASRLVDSVKLNIQQAKSPTHTRDLLDVLYSVLKARQTLIELYPGNATLLLRDSAVHFETLFQKVYLPLWQKYIVDASGTEADVLNGVTSGVAMLVVQQIAGPDGKRSLLCSSEVCSEITTLFVHRLLMPLTLSPREAAAMVADSDIGLQEALSTIVTSYMDGFAVVVALTKAAVLSRDWKSIQKRHTDHLWHTICRVSFISCSKIPEGMAVSTAAGKKYSSLSHFLTWTGALLQLLEWTLANQANPRVVQLVVAGIHHSIRCFRDACGSPARQVKLHDNDDGQVDWAKEIAECTAGGDLPADWLRLLSDYYEIYDGLGLKPAEETQTTAIGGEAVLANFTRLSLFIVRHLYRRFTTERGGVLHLADGLDYTQTQLTAVIDQISKMAALTIQALDAPSQQFYKLSREAFQLFREGQAASPHRNAEDSSNGVLSLLTLGIVSSLWPDAMTDLVSYHYSG